MGLIGLIITLALVGFLVWLITTKIPMSDTFKIAIQVIVVVVVILFLMRLFGIADIPLPSAR